MKSFIPFLVLGLVSTGSCSIYCGVAHGYDLGTNAYYYSGDGALDSFAACSSTCQGSAQCQSFAFGNNSCLLYTVPLDVNFRSQGNSPYLFYDRDCVNVQSTSSFATTLAPVTVAPTTLATVPATAPAAATTTPKNAPPAAQTSPQGSNNDPTSGAAGEGSSEGGSHEATSAGAGGEDQQGGSPTTAASSYAGNDAAVTTQSGDSASVTAAADMTATGTDADSTGASGSQSTSTARGGSSSTASGTGASLQTGSSSSNSGAGAMVVPDARWFMVASAGVLAALLM